MLLQAIAVTVEMELIRHAVLSGRLVRHCYFYIRETAVPEDTPENIYKEFVDRVDLNRLDLLRSEIEGTGRPVRTYTPTWTGRGFKDLEKFGTKVREDIWSGVLRDPRFVPKRAWREVLGTEPESSPLYEVWTSTERSLPTTRPSVSPRRFGGIWCGLRSIGTICSVTRRGAVASGR